jgi:hypothetical protein
MRARLIFAITIIRAEPLRRLGAQICIETLAKVMKSPSTEWLFDPMVAKADLGVREIFVRLAPGWHYIRWTWTCARLCSIS